MSLLLLLSWNAWALEPACTVSWDAWDAHMSSPPDAVTLRDGEVLVTDGSSADNVVLTTESNKYVALGIDVVAVGIDEAVTSQLEAIASDPSFVYQATTFAELGGFGETLTAQMCDQPIGYTTPAP